MAYKRIKGPRIVTRKVEISVPEGETVQKAFLNWTFEVRKTSESEGFKREIDFIFDITRCIEGFVDEDDKPIDIKHEPKRSDESPEKYAKRIAPAKELLGELLNDLFVVQPFRDCYLHTRMGSKPGN